MVYQLLLKRPERGRRGIAKNVLIDDLPTQYKVYLFYFPGGNRLDYQDTEDRLINFGTDAGNNLLVATILNDHSQFTLFSEIFGVNDFPTIVISGVPSLASTKSENKHTTICVKLENKRLLRRPATTVESVSRIFNSFMRGDIRGALRQSRRDQRGATVSHIKDAILERLGRVEVTVSLLKGLLDINLKRRRDG